MISQYFTQRILPGLSTRGDDKMLRVDVDNEAREVHLRLVEKRMKHIALGVNIGNLSRQRTRREPMLARCDRINRYLARKNADLRVIGFYRHTGNLVLKTTTLHPAQAAQAISEADGGAWMAVSEATMRKRVREVHKLQAPEGERGVRWTPGLAFAIRKPRIGDITSSAKVRLRSIDLGTVAVWKRDRITERGRLDSKMREGGWGAVSGPVADQTNSQWTARSLTTLEGVLDRPNPVHTTR
jgi:hypothetical protein